MANFSNKGSFIPFVTNTSNFKFCQQKCTLTLLITALSIELPRAVALYYLRAWGYWSVLQCFLLPR